MWQHGDARGQDSIARTKLGGALARIATMASQRWGSRFSPPSIARGASAFTRLRPPAGSWAPRPGRSAAPVRSPCLSHGVHLWVRKRVLLESGPRGTHSGTSRRPDIWSSLGTHFEHTLWARSRGTQSRHALVARTPVARTLGGTVGAGCPEPANASFSTTRSAGQMHFRRNPSLVAGMARVHALSACPKCMQRTCAGITWGCHLPQKHDCGT